MNRFGSGYDDLFEEFEAESRETNAEGPADPSPASGDVRPVDDPDEIARFLAKAMRAVGDLEDGAGGRLGGATSRPRDRQGARLNAPADVVESPEGLLIVFDLPGVAEEDVELAAAPRAIRLRASRRLPLPPGSRARLRERVAGTIERVIPVPPGFDCGSLEARLTGGVLAVLVPRHEASEPDGWDQQGGSGLWNEG